MKVTTERKSNFPQHKAIKTGHILQLLIEKSQLTQVTTLYRRD